MIGATPVERRLGPEELAVRAGGMAAERGAGRDVAEHGALGRDPGPVADHQMIGHAHVAGQDDVVPDARAARDADARHEQAAASDPDVVADVDEVVDLGARADHRVVHAPAVDAGVGADLDVVLDDAAADVGDPVVALPRPER